MFDINEPVINPALVETIEAIQKETTPSTQNAFLKEVKKAKFLLSVNIDPPPPPGDDGKTVLKVDTIISFESITDINGENYLPVYTDWPALKQWRDVPDERTWVISYDDIRAMIYEDQKSSGFVINPYSHNIPVRKEIMKILNADSATTWTVEKDTPVRIGQPADDPIALKKAISDYLKTQKNVESAYLVLMEKEQELSFLVVVDFVGDRQTVFNGIASVAVPKLRHGELIDMMPMDDGIGKNVARDYPPFYTREG